jgi:uncharacterized membrane protein YccC
MWRNAARLTGPAVADRLTAAVPGWLMAAARTRSTPVPWRQMLRAAIAICLPVSAGIATGQRELGLLTAMGGLLGTVVDNGGAYPARLKRVGSAAVFGGAAGITIGSLIHGRGWIAVVALMAVAFVSALLSAISDVGSVTGLQLLVYSSLGLGPIGALRPWWHTALGFVLGAAWALLLTVPGWLLSPRAAEQRSVAAVYRALAGGLRALGTSGFPAARRGITAALNAAYDTLLTARSTAGGRSPRLQRLMAILNQANLVAEAVATLSREADKPPEPVIEAVERLAGTVETGKAVPAMPPVPGNSPGMTELRDALTGLWHALSGNWAAAAVPSVRRASAWQRLADVAGRADGGLSRRFAFRITVCIGAAAVMSEVLPLQRSYWVVLTVAIVLKPDLGSVFARAVQRGIGTVIGAVLGAVILVLVPYGPWLLLPFGLLAALLPYGRSRNFGLMAVFLTPLVVVLIDLLTVAGWRLALDRLLDTLLGCAIALLIGYAPWPGSWQAHLPGQFAETIRDVAAYLEEALVTSWAPPAAAGAARPAGTDGTARPPHAGSVAQPSRLPQRSRLRRRTYRALSDLRVEFERTMAEPPAISRRATAWWPALVGLEEVADAVTATAVAISHGAPAPSADAVRQLTAALAAIAGAVQGGQALPGAELPPGEPLQPVTDAVRSVLSVIASPKRPAAT